MANESNTVSLSNNLTCRFGQHEFLLTATFDYILMYFNVISEMFQDKIRQYSHRFPISLICLQPNHLSVGVSHSAVFTHVLFDICPTALSFHPEVRSFKVAYLNVRGRGPGC